MWLRKKHRPSDPRGTIRAAGRPIRTLRQEGFTYVDASGQVVIKALKQQGFKPCSAPGAASPPATEEPSPSPTYDEYLSGSVLELFVAIESGKLDLDLEALRAVEVGRSSGGRPRVLVKIDNRMAHLEQLGASES